MGVWIGGEERYRGPVFSFFPFIIKYIYIISSIPSCAKLAFRPPCFAPILVSRAWRSMRIIDRYLKKTIYTYIVVTCA